jgi:hypothetical protein
LARNEKDATVLSVEVSKFGPMRYELIRLPDRTERAFAGRGDAEFKQAAEAERDRDKTRKAWPFGTAALLGAPTIKIPVERWNVMRSRVPGSKRPAPPPTTR